MLQIVLPQCEEWDEVNEEFIYLNEQAIQLEHSLVSISKWEAKWNRAFLGKQKKTSEEVLDYIRCMLISQDVDPNVINRLSEKNIEEINNYIDAPMTATRFSNNSNASASREQVTSELIYWWMITLNIPIECQNWHLNRLITLIEVCSRKNQSPRKKSVNELLRSNSALNKERRKQLDSKG